MPREMNLVWMDLEMTGLDPDRDTIIEIATVITDSDLALVAEGPSLPIHHPDDVLASMGAWCVEHHGRSGLTQRVRESTVTMAQAQERTLEFVRAHCFPKTSPLCGNTIGQDRRFLARHMPVLHDFFHYRSIDVSTVKELVRRWYPPEKHFPPKADRHEAMGDVRDSIRELAFYRKTVFA